jgi:hypothetical protein
VLDDAFQLHARVGGCSRTLVNDCLFRNSRERVESIDRSSVLLSRAGTKIHVSHESYVLLSPTITVRFIVFTTGTVLERIGFMTSHL